MTHTLVPLSEPARWRAALRGIPHAFAHTHGHCRAMQLTSGLETFLYSYEGDNGRVVCPLSVREYAGYPDVLTPYGFSGPAGAGACPEFPDAWETFARSRGFVCGYLGLNPALDRGLYHRAEDEHAFNSAFLLDLTTSEAALFARLSTNRRRQMREWEGGGATLVMDRPRLARFFAEHLRAFLDARRAARVYYLAPESLDALFALDDVALLGVAVEGRLEAVSVFGWSPYIGDYLFNVSVPEGRRHSAPLIWHGALRLKALGVPLLNLGGGIRPGDGVAEFKARFGGREVPLRSVRQVYAADLFATLCRRAGADPADRGGYFPPYHAR